MDTPMEVLICIVISVTMNSDIMNYSFIRISLYLCCYWNHPNKISIDNLREKYISLKKIIHAHACMHTKIKYVNFPKYTA